MIASPTQAAAQNGCQLVGSREWRVVARGTAAETHWFTRASFLCDDGSRIYSDSAIVSPPQNLSQLFGNVRFTEVGRTLTSDRANYRSDIDRLDAFGNVILDDSIGASRIEGTNLVYLRAGSARTSDQLTVTGVPGQRPRATITPRASTAPVEADSTPADTLVVDSIPSDTLIVDSIPADTLIVDSTVALAPVRDSLPGHTAVDPALAAPPPEPYIVVADRIVIEGNNAFRGEGNAEIDRGSLRAYGASMVYDGGVGELLIAGDARSVGEGYELTGQSITVVLPGDEIREIVARRQAALVSSDLDLTAPKIRIFVEDDALQRLVAAQLRQEDGPAFADAVSGPPQPQQPRSGNTSRETPTRDPNRAVAVGDGFLLLGDSLDVATPGEALESVVAIGRGRAESYARDSLNTADTPELARYDWIEGDTLHATFARMEAPVLATDVPGPVGQEGDEQGEYVLERLVATGDARSLYRLEPSDSTGTGPRSLAIHYVLGTGITIEMREGDIDLMEVSGDTRGYHLEPNAVASLTDTLTADSLSADGVPVDSVPADTLQPDTLQPDTGRASGGTGSGGHGAAGDDRQEGPAFTGPEDSSAVEEWVWRRT